MDELTKKANEVKSRFSISSYYHSQEKDPTPEMLKQINAEIDPETGNVVKKKRVKKEAKTTEKKEKKTKGEESDAMIEMELESDNEEEIELESDDDDDGLNSDKSVIGAKDTYALAKEKAGHTYAPVKEDAVDWASEKDGKITLAKDTDVSCTDCSTKKLDCLQDYEEAGKR